MPCLVNKTNGTYGLVSIKFNFHGHGQFTDGFRIRKKRGFLLSADTIPTPTPTRFSGVGACRWAFYRHRQPFRVGSTDKANGAAGFSVGWHSAPPIPMPATPALTDTLLITFRSCAAPLQSGCVARMLNIWYLDAYCIPGVHGRSCLIPERSWLANAPWRPRKGALIPAVLWSSPRKSCRAGCLRGEGLSWPDACGREGDLRGHTVANCAWPGCTLRRRDDCTPLAVCLFHTHTVTEPRAQITV